jgi:hypothetical protein
MTVDVTRLLALEVADARRAVVDARFSFRFLTPDDVRIFSADPSNDLSASFGDRLECGHDVCYAVLDADALVGYSWLALGSIEEHHNRGLQRGSGVTISFPADTAFCYKGFTRPEYRGFHTHSVCFTDALEALSRHGVRRLLLTTDWLNQPALASCRRAGFRDVGLIWRVGWPGAMFTVTPRAARPLGLRFGRRARVQERTTRPFDDSTTDNPCRRPALQEI